MEVPSSSPGDKVKVGCFNKMRHMPSKVIKETTVSNQFSDRNCKQMCEENDKCVGYSTNAIPFKVDVPCYLSSSTEMQETDGNEWRACNIDKGGKKPIDDNKPKPTPKPTDAEVDNKPKPT